MDDKSEFSGGMTSWYRVLLPVWAGQTVSLVGSGLSEFALSLWVDQHTQSVTQFAFVLLFRTLPVILLSPLVGVLVDRWDRRKIMIVSASGSALCSIMIAVLFVSDQLQPWQVCVASAFSAGFGALQSPAYLSAISSMVPKESLARVNGLLQISQSVSDVVVPVLAATLMVMLGVSGIVMIDFFTFILAVLALSCVRFASHITTGENQKLGVMQSFLSGLNYLRSRPELTSLMSFNMTFAFLSGMLGALLIPLFMGITTVQGMGLVLTVAGSGLLSGSLVMTVAGRTSSYRKNMLSASLLFGVALLCLGVSSNIFWVGAFAFIAHFIWPYIFGANQALWQSVVNLDIQGRIFATRQMIVRTVQPIALLLAGFAADNYFEPLMQPGKSFAMTLGKYIGMGAGRGAGLLVACIGLLVVFISFIFIFSKPLKRLDGELG